MKILELELHKRLLIVESDNANEFFIMNHIPAGTYYLICKGSELTEEIAKGLVKSLPCQFSALKRNYRDYTKEHKFPVDAYLKITAMESFISAIESKGWFWSKNDLTDSIPAPDIEEWEDAQSKTFNPDKTIIFEIL